MRHRLTYLIHYGSDLSVSEIQSVYQKKFLRGVLLLEKMGSDSSKVSNDEEWKKKCKELEKKLEQSKEEDEKREAKFCELQQQTSDYMKQQKEAFEQLAVRFCYSYIM